MYRLIQIESDGLGRPEAFGYYRPINIAIRSGKHSSSTANAHALYFVRFLNIPEFLYYITKNPADLVERVVLWAVNGSLMTTHVIKR